ncbi:MAG TPA: hypothetical protein VK698_34105 [Kofleriaceae bacterium]|nr:hypothetical protein [Kofleriaceae bacterium]
MRWALAVALLAACHGGGGGGSSSSGAVAVGDVAGARAALGKAVVVVGTAQMAKLGPIVQSGDLVVYCIDLDPWPDALTGKRVTARGTLDFTQEYDARRSPGGVISAGTSGGVFVLRGCAVDTAAP